MSLCSYVPFSSLVGVTLSSAVYDTQNEVIRFHAKDDRFWEMRHKQGCCESVSVESINGDLQDLVGSPILIADESTSEDNPEDVFADCEYVQSQTWTFYHIATAKGRVDIRWYGTSNGWYSESVDLHLTDYGDNS